MANLLLGCGASVAIYKACDLASKLTQAGHAVRVVLTPSAAELVSPQLFEAVTGERASVSEFGDGRSGAMDHIRLGQWAELVLIAPATADLIGRLAHGLAGALVPTAVLACPAGRPRLIAPAMNPGMLAQPAVKRNLEQLRADGWSVIAPEVGHMACGDDGAGRLPEPAALAARVAEALAR